MKKPKKSPFVVYNKQINFVNLLNLVRVEHIYCLTLPNKIGIRRVNIERLKRFSVIFHLEQKINNKKITNLKI